MANYTTNKPPHVVVFANTIATQVTGPAGGVVIATLGVLAKGLYLISVETVYTGTLTASETLGNMKLQSGGGVAATPVDVAVLVTPPAVGAVAPTQWFLVNADGVNAVRIVAVGAAGAAAVYGAHMVAYPMHTAT